MTDTVTTVFEQANADGRALAARHDWSGAEQAFRRATIGAEQLDDDAAAAVALANLGRALFHGGELAKAEAALRRSVALRETLAARGDGAGLAQALNDLAVVLTAARPTDLAGEPTALFERAMEHAAHAGDRPLDLVAGNAARAHLAAGDAASAEPIVEGLAARAARRDDAADWDAALHRVRSTKRASATAPARASDDASADDVGLVFLAIEPDAESDDAPDRDEPSLEFLSLATAADETDVTAVDDRAPLLETMELTSLVDEPEAPDTTLHFVSLLDEPEPIDAMAAVHDEPLVLDVEPVEHEAAVIADAHELAPATEPVELDLPAPVESAPASDALDGLVSFDATRDVAAADEDQAERADADTSFAGERAEQRAEPRRKGRKRRGRDTRPRPSPAIGGARVTPPTAERGVPAIAALPMLDVDAPLPFESTSAAPVAGPSGYASELEWVEAGASEIVPRVRQTTGDFAALFDTPEYAELGRTVGRVVQQAEPASRESSELAPLPEIAWEPPIEIVQQAPVAHEPPARDALAEVEPATQADSGARVVDELELPMPEGGASASPDASPARPERPSRERSLTPPTAMTAPTRRSWWRRLTSFGRGE